LSQTTVSRALNGYPEVSESTRERVLKFAQQHNYRPNTRASSLATGKAMAIGHIVPFHSNIEVFNPIFAEFIAGASQTYSLRGYELILTMANSENEEANYRSIASKGAVDGVIVHAPRLNDPRIELLNNLGLPFVIHGRDTENTSNYSWIDINNKRAFYQATKLLIDLGHEKIGLINGRETLNFAWRRRMGYTEALSDCGLTVDTDLMYSGDLNESNGYLAASQSLAGNNPPTAFLVSSYVGALGVRRAIHQAGLEMGKFTATRSSVRDAGALAAQMLLDIIDDPGCAPLTQMLDARLTLGASTGPCKQ